MQNEKIFAWLQAMIEKVTDSIGQRIQQARIACGMSQTELARRLSVKPQSVQHWERGTSRPKTGRIQQLAQILDVQPSWLLLNDIQHREHQLGDMALNQDEALLVKTYRRMDGSRRKFFNEIVDALVRNVE